MACDSLKSASDETAVSAAAQTACPSRDGPALDHHFAAFVKATVAGSLHLVELDGTKPFPVDHGGTSAETFMRDVGRVVREQFMELDPECIEFSCLALVRK